MARVLTAATLFGFLAMCAVALFIVNKSTMNSLYYLHHRSRAIISANYVSEHLEYDPKSSTRKMLNGLISKASPKQVNVDARGTYLDDLHFVPRSRPFTFVESRTDVEDLDQDSFPLISDSRRSVNNKFTVLPKYSMTQKTAEVDDEVVVHHSRHKKNVQNSVKVTSNSKYLVYMCGGTVHKCGGLADRLKGIIHGYILANITRRQFRINMPLPGCEFSSFLGVNQVDWRINMSLIKEKNLTMTVYNRLNMFCFAEELETFNFTEFWKDADVVLYTSNLERMKSLRANRYHASDLGWIRERSNCAIYREILHYLFTLTPPLLKEVNEVIEQVKSRAHSEQGAESTRPSKSEQSSRSGPSSRSIPGSDFQNRQGKLVCAQIRMGQNPTIPGDTQIRVKVEHLKVIWRFMKQSLPNASVSFFVSTDSEGVLDEARRVFGTRLLEVKGSIVHVDKVREHDDLCVGMRRVIVDMHVLTRCDVLLLTKSGVGILAAYLREKSTGLYMLKLNSSNILHVSSERLQRM